MSKRKKLVLRRTTNSQKKSDAEGMSQRDFVLNLATMRQQALKSLIDQGNRDINESCKYPDVITPADYHEMYQREGIAARVVDVMPNECWTEAPKISETDDAEENTAFEEALETLNNKKHLDHHLARIDRLSGVGRFGILLIGIDDGKPLTEPVDGVTDDGEFSGTRTEATRKLLYLRPFEESVVEVADSVTDVSNPRFGLPNHYNVTFQDENSQSFSQKIHWTRVIHVAEHREMSEVYATPRMMKLYNRLMDIRKILSGSGEMFWKGAFPGISFEVNSDDTGAELDKEGLRNEMQAYMDGLQRYLALDGVSAKSLAPQVASPAGHLDAQLDYISIALGVPKRVFMGSEQGELASSQDSKTWNKRVMKRQNDYLTPLVIRPFIDRLMQMGILPYVEEYTVKWPDLMSTTEAEKAEIATKWANAFAKYVAGDVEQMIPMTEFLKFFAGMDDDEIKQIADALEEFQREQEEDMEDVDDSPEALAEARGENDNQDAQDEPGDDQEEEEEE